MKVRDDGPAVRTARTEALNIVADGVLGGLRAVRT